MGGLTSISQAIVREERNTCDLLPRECKAENATSISGGRESNQKATKSSLFIGTL